MVGEAIRPNLLRSISKRHRFPGEIIGHAVWLHCRLPLSLRRVEKLLAERGIDLSFQAVSEWPTEFGREYPELPHPVALRKRGRRMALNSAG